MVAALAKSGNGPHQALVCLDVETGKEEEWSNGVRYYMHEASFVAKPDSGVCSTAMYAAATDWPFHMLPARLCLPAAA